MREIGYPLVPNSTAFRRALMHKGTRTRICTRAFGCYWHYAKGATAAPNTTSGDMAAEGRQVAREARENRARARKTLQVDFCLRSPACLL